MLSAEASSAICVQRLDDSRNSAIHTTYRISLRSSSLREPRYPLLRVVLALQVAAGDIAKSTVCFRAGVQVQKMRRPPGDPPPKGKGPPARPERTDPFEAGRLGEETSSPFDRDGARGHRVGSIDSMILPQVHLRKPCYDFSFL